MASDGHSYERESISLWFKSGNGTSPKTGEPMADERLVPNHLLRGLIIAWREAKEKETAEAKAEAGGKAEAGDEAAVAAT